MDRADNLKDSSVGYEHGYGAIKFKIQSNSADEIAKAFLGVGELKIQNFEMTRSRFGIEDTRNQLMVSTAVLQTSPTTRVNCTIKIRPEGKGNLVTVSGKAARTRFPKSYVRVSSDFLDLIWSTENNEVQFKSRITIEERRKLGALLTHVKLLDLFTSCRADVQIWVGGRRSFGGRTSKADDNRWGKLLPALTFLHSIGQDDPEISIAEIVAASAEFERFRMILADEGVSSTLDFMDVERLPLGAERILYSAQVTIGSATFFALGERPILKEQQLEGRRQFDLGDPHIIDSYVVTGASPDGQFQADFEREINRKSRTLGIADIRPAFEGRDIGMYTSPGFDRADGSVE